MYLCPSWRVCGVVGGITTLSCCYAAASKDRGVSKVVPCRRRSAGRHNLPATVDVSRVNWSSHRQWTAWTANSVKDGRTGPLCTAERRQRKSTNEAEATEKCDWIPTDSVNVQLEISAFALKSNTSEHAGTGVGISREMFLMFSLQQQEDYPVGWTGVQVRRRWYPLTRRCAGVGVHHVSSPSVVSHSRRRSSRHTSHPVVSSDHAAARHKTRRRRMFPSLGEQQRLAFMKQETSIYSDKLAQFLPLVIVFDETNCCLSLVEHSYTQFNFVLLVTADNTSLSTDSSLICVQRGRIDRSTWGIQVPVEFLHWYSYASCVAYSPRRLRVTG